MSKGMGSIVNFRALGSLRRIVVHGHLLSLALFLSLALAACTSSAVAGDPADNGATSGDSGAREVSVADNNIGGAGPEGDIPLQIDALDADTIVAAQEQVLSGIYERVVPSVVQIRSVRHVGQQRSLPGSPDVPGFPFGPFPNAPQDPEDFYQRSGGSGFVWDSQGHIVTNHHVIEGADRVTVIFADRTELEGEVLGSDPDSDLAVLKVDLTDLDLRPVDLGDSASVKVGQLAAAIGNPFGQEFTITTGIISAVGRTIQSGNSQFSIPQVVQTDAPINPGNSGGPLLDRQGRVIGVNTQIISRNGASSGIGFAVPINTAKRVIPILVETGKYEYAWLGISGTSLTPDAAELMELPRNTKGALVIELSQKGPAEMGGIQGSDNIESLEGIEYRLGGDIIVGIDGRPIEDMDELIAYLIENTLPGDEVEIEVIRDGGSHETLAVTLGKRPGA